MSLKDSIRGSLECLVIHRPGALLSLKLPQKTDDFRLFLRRHSLDFVDHIDRFHHFNLPSARPVCKPGFPVKIKSVKSFFGEFLIPQKSSIRWKSLDQKAWCLHCNQQFAGKDVRVYRHGRDLLRECGTPQCNGSPLDWAEEPWWR